MNILSIQSAVSYGYVGNSAAVFALQRMGHTVWPINTVVFSNHPEYGVHTGRVLPPSETRTLLDGLDMRGVLPRCNALLSGYLGDAGTGETVLHAAMRVRQGNTRALFALDPVIGDMRRGVYVRKGVPEFFRDEAVKAADIVLPNVFELAYLAGAEATTASAALLAAKRLLLRGPRLVVVKGIHEEDRVISLAVEAGQAWRVTTPRIDAPTQGAGDAFSAIFLGKYLEAREAADALSHAAASLFGILRATSGLGLDHLALIEAQEQIVDPTQMFGAEPI